MRKPDRIIGQNYLSRWYLIPRNRFMNIYLHKFTGSDYDRALHDHPWWSVSFLLKGRLIEVHKIKDCRDFRWIPRFLPVFRSAVFAHRLVLPFSTTAAWTIFITGPAVRRWGFLCPGGWKHWDEVVTYAGDPIEGSCE